jgi:hypothetical protein
MVVGKEIKKDSTRENLTGSYLELNWANVLEFLMDMKRGVTLEIWKDIGTD